MSHETLAAVANEGHAFMVENFDSAVGVLEDSIYSYLLHFVLFHFHVYFGFDIDSLSQMAKYFFDFLRSQSKRAKLPDEGRAQFS